MKLGPNLRRKYTSLHEFARKVSPVLDHIRWLLLDPTKFKRIHNSNIKKLLVVLVNEEAGNVGGDFCLLGVVNHFKKTFPHIDVSFLSDKSSISRFGQIPGIDFIEYKDKSTLNALKTLNIDSAIFINLGPLNSKDFLFIPYRIGVFYPSIGSLLHLKNKLYYTRKPFISWGTHMVEFNFKMLEALGFNFKSKDTVMHYDEIDKKPVNAFLTKNKIKKYIVIHPGGKHVSEAYLEGKVAPHLWPLDRYAKFADHFAKKGYKIIMTGTKNEKILLDELNSKTKTKILDGCGTFTIREIAHLLKKSDLLIGTDTAITHIAYQVKTPMIMLFGPSCPETSGPWPLNAKRHKIIIDKGPCERSMKKTFCPEDIPCLNNIQTETIINESEKMLKTQSTFQ